jgi:hypothetical protein
MRHLIFACLFCLGVAGAAQADGNTGLIYGRVLIAGSHVPVCPITVTVNSDREPLQKTTTSNNGEFHFLLVSPGTVVVTIGRSRVVRSLTISPNIQNLDLILEPFYLSPQPIVTTVSSARTQLIERVCHGHRQYFSAYGYSDYDPDP